jgi:hypothetical protein
VVTAASGSTITHQPAVASAGSVGDGVPANNSATSNTSVTAGTVLTMAKSHDGGQLLVGQSFNFTLAPRFSGSAPTGVTLTDTLPANFQIAGTVSAAAGWNCSVSGQTVSCTRSNIGTGGADVALGNIVIPVIALTAGTGVVNDATVNATGPVATSATGSAPADVANSATDFRADKRRSWPQNNVPINQPFDYQVGAPTWAARACSRAARSTAGRPAVGVQINSVTPGDGYTCTIMKGGATVVPTPAAPVPGPATVNCTRTLCTDIDVDLSSRQQRTQRRLHHRERHDPGGAPGRRPDRQQHVRERGAACRGTHARHGPRRQHRQRLREPGHRRERQRQLRRREGAQARGRASATARPTARSRARTSRGRSRSSTTGPPRRRTSSSPTCSRR